jgi:hypothetical protein
MRSLRVLGIAENGSHLVCAEPDGSAEPFALPLDDRLRAAVRGDLSRFGQLEIEMEPQLRPREIQSRIRAGASIEQVAAAAGCAPERIERYAYPVLMERTTVAERAQRIRPLRDAAIGTSGAAGSRATLVDIVTATLADRGQQQAVTWDAFRDERGWTVTATWRAGRSENRAEWTYHPGPDGGTLAARNEAASDLVEPAPKPLRTIGDDNRGGDEVRGGSAPRREHGRPASKHQPALDDARTARTSRLDDERLAEDTVTDRRSGALVAPDDDSDTQQSPQPSAQPARATGTTGAPHGSTPAGSPSRGARRGNRPPMPSWEDVLLGTRASGR